MTTIGELHRGELVVKNARLVQTLHSAEATIKSMEALANDERQKRHQAEDARVEARSALAYAEQTIERHRLEHGELARHVADLTHDLIAAEQRAKVAEREAEEYGAHAAESAFEIVRLQEALAAVMIPIEALAAAGEDAWELAPEVRAELMTARTIGRAAFDKDKKP